jgi:ABC-type transporter Mla subunit MlaD
MADSDPLSQMFNLFAAPLAGTLQSFEQFRKGVDEFLRGVENFNRTMENLNETTERINRLVTDVEGPIRAAVPQMTRTVKAADDMMQVVSGPAMAAAPGLERLAKTLTTPAFTQLPDQLGQFSDILGDLQARLGPLTQLAETAGGLFGGFRRPGVTGAAPAPEPSAPTPPVAVKKTTAKKATPQKKAAPKKATPQKKATAKKSDE